MAKYDNIDFTPPAGVRAEAQKGLDWRSEYGRGGTAIGIARGRDLSNGTKISPDTARRMKAYFDRHEVDKKGEGYKQGDKGFPSTGRIAWALWGGDAGYSWSKKLVRQMESEDTRSFEMDIERRSITGDETSEVPTLSVETRCAAEGNKRTEWIVGYAAKFNIRADLGEFSEQIHPRAFMLVTERRGRKKPLETRALWNHDANFPLARYPETLSLTVDEIGLRYEFPVPQTTYGKDVAENIRSGIIRGSSFAFSIAPGGEEWTQEKGRSIRTVTTVGSLVDVGPVCYPAYAQANVSVAKRSLDAFRGMSQKELLMRKRIAEIAEYYKKNG